MTGISIQQFLSIECVCAGRFGGPPSDRFRLLATAVSFDPFVKIIDVLLTNVYKQERMNAFV